MHAGHDVLPVDHDPSVPRRAERHVERGPILGHVDPVATEHRIDALAQAALLRELDEEPDRLVA